MNLKLKTDKQEYPVFGFSMSLFIHVLIIAAAALILNSSIEESKTGTPYVQIRTIESQPELKTIKPEDKKPNETQNEEKEKPPVEEKEVTPKKETMQNSENAVFYDFSDSTPDTNSLVQVYKENTLDVSLKYPAGWTYLDQDVKNTLDGVTFWTNSADYNPPPYVHIEVKDKDLFNPKRFKHNYKTRNYTAYYNEPEELSGQVTQIIYIRTNTEKDFSLKLIMKGEEAFKSFQPVFFGMVKSFKYGNQFF